jgi:hypothetical protein
MDLNGHVQSLFVGLRGRVCFLTAHWLIPPGYAQPTVGGQKEQQDHHHTEPPLATPRKTQVFLWKKRQVFTRNHGFFYKSFYGVPQNLRCWPTNITETIGYH